MLNSVRSRADGIKDAALRLYTIILLANADDRLGAGKDGKKPLE